MRIILLMLFLLIYPASGAVIKGTVYSWENLEPLPKAIVTINTTPEQRVVAKNGTYSFTVPPGTYEIRAYYYSNGELELYDNETITVKGNGTYVLDLILFPTLNVSEEVPNVQLNLGKSKGGFPLFWIALAIVPIILALCYKLRKSELKKGDSEEDELPEDLKEVVEIIKKEGGRITQKELRKRLGYSEAKISLMVADLERRGIVEKVKKGRGNILFLKK